jgi:hypothetical protein
VRLTLHPESERHVIMDPYPFDIRPLELRIPYRRLEQATFPDTATFRKTYFQTPTQFMTYVVD